MDQILEITIAIVGVGATIAGLFAGIGYFKKGRIDGKLDTITLFKEQVDALETKVNTQTTDIERMSKEIHELKAAIDEKDKKLSETLAILQLRNPEMNTFLEMMKTYIDTNTPILEIIKGETIPTIKSLQKFLDKQSF